MIVSEKATSFLESCDDFEHYPINLLVKTSYSGVLESLNTQLASRAPTLFSRSTYKIAFRDFFDGKVYYITARQRTDSFQPGKILQ